MLNTQKLRLRLNRWFTVVLLLSLLYSLKVHASSNKEYHPFRLGYSYRITPDNLFYIQRNIDKNLVVYDANLLGNRVLNPHKPVKVYWIRNTEGGIRKELSIIQSKMAYGIIIKKVAGPRITYEAKLAAYKERVIMISYNDSGYPVALMNINGKLQQLHHIFIEVLDTKHVIPKIGFIQVFGKDLQTGNEVSEKIIPE